MISLTNNNSNQDGFVSIIVTMIMMIVLSIIVLGFAQTARREEREALDRQLSTQAFYAAESGINDAVTAYNKGNTSKPNCNLDTLFSPAPDFQSLDKTNTVSYTCLTLKSALPSLNYKVDSSSTLAPIHSVGLTYLQLSWQATDTSANFSNQFSAGPNSTPLFPATNKFNGTTGVIELSLTPLDLLDRQDLIKNTMTAFLYPDPDSSPNAFGNIDMGTTISSAANQGPIVSGHCNLGSKPNYCNVVISNLQHSSAGYMLRLRSLYYPSSLTVCGSITAGNQLACNATFSGAQLQVDSTGRANDVLRRIQENYPLNGTSIIPEYAIESADSLCKTLLVTPTTNTEDVNSANCPTLPKASD